MDTQLVKETTRNPIFVAVASPLLLGLVIWLWNANTTDDEVLPDVILHEERLVQQEIVTKKIAKDVNVNAIQTAFIGQKFASDDIRRLEKKQVETPAEFTSDDRTSLDTAERRLKFSQSVLDEAMGMPDE